MVESRIQQLSLLVAAQERKVIAQDARVADLIRRSRDAIAQVTASGRRADSVLR